MNNIRIRTRDRDTDFGNENFYLTDSFKATYVWASRNTQVAISIFEIPDEYFQNPEHTLSFDMDHIVEWKQLVFNVRNQLRSGQNLRRRLDEYENFIAELDVKNLISGPIFANPGTRLLENVEYVRYLEHIPFQFSFKRTSINYLNQCSVLTIFFRER